MAEHYVAITPLCKGVVPEGLHIGSCDCCPPKVKPANALDFRERGRATRAALRAEGQDPAHSELANQRRGSTAGQQLREARQWDTAHGGEADPEVFRQEILTGLQTVSLSAMA